MTTGNKTVLLVALFAGFVVAGLTVGCTVSSPFGQVVQDHELQPGTAGDSTAQHVQQVSHQTETESPALITLGPKDSLVQIIEQAQGNVLIDFYADWCGPCKKQARTLHELEPIAAKVDALIVKIDVDQHTDLANQFQVTSLPTLVLVKDGSVVERLTGYANAARVESLLTR